MGNKNGSLKRWKIQRGKQSFREGLQEQGDFMVILIPS